MFHQLHKTHTSQHHAEFLQMQFMDLNMCLGHFQPALLFTHCIITAHTAARVIISALLLCPSMQQEATLHEYKLHTYINKQWSVIVLLLVQQQGAHRGNEKAAFVVVRFQNAVCDVFQTQDWLGSLAAVRWNNVQWMPIAPMTGACKRGERMGWLQRSYY